MRTGHRLRRGLILALCAQWSLAWAAGAPDWMRAQLGATVPEHDEETDAVLMLSEVELTVLAPGKLKRLDRRVYKILRPDGDRYGTVVEAFDAQSRITAMRGWSIPAQGKDFEVKERDIVETAFTDVENGELASDLRRKAMLIPAAVPGNLVGYEIEQEVQPYRLTDEWYLQDSIPVREARYTLRLPPGWSYKAFWINRDGAAPAETGPGQFRWTVPDLKAVRFERDMPPWRGVAARMVLSLQPPAGGVGGFQSWQDVGSWYAGLTEGRRAPSPALREKVQQLTASAPDTLRKMQALATFAQNDIRYVGIWLGIGGHQPHPASEVFEHSYGDCKDKVTLLSSMLKEIGIESHYVLINTARGAIGPGTPPNLGFNHAIIAIQLPGGIDPRQLPAAITHKTLGPVLFFDPTNSLVPLGQLPGALQANYGLLVAPGGGELLALPQAAPALNGVQRTAKLTLADNGTLSGDVRETWSGDAAWGQRYVLRTAQRDVDQIKPVESMLAHSLPTFQILRAAVGNQRAIDQPLIWNYALEVPSYPRVAGDLLIVRPRVLGSMSSALLETRKPRVHPIEFDAPARSTDTFEITVPPGYVLDSLPPPVNQDLGFISYRSATTFSGQVLRYTRTLEVKELSVPVAKADALKQFYRTIESDERNSALLKKAP